jgi:flagellar basal-body rod protein FlgC
VKYLCLIVIFWASPLMADIASSNSCEQVLKDIQLDMNVIASNIANVSTTRTPEGGPYHRKELQCQNGYCDIVEFNDTFLEYLPDHPDADQFGYVKFPNIDLQSEISSMLEASRAYESEVKDCK